MSGWLHIPSLFRERKFSRISMFKTPMHFRYFRFCNLSSMKLFKRVMLVEIVIVGLIWYWLGRDPRELRDYEETFLRKFVHPHGDVTWPIPSEFRDQPELRYKLCRRFVKRSKAPRLEVRHLGFKKAIHHSIPVQVVKCGKGVAIIQAPFFNTFYVLRKGKEKDPYNEKKVYNIACKAYYITDYIDDDDEEELETKPLVRSLSLADHDVSRSDYVPAILPRSYSAPRGHLLKPHVNRPDITAPNYSHIIDPQGYPGSTEKVRRFSAEQGPFVQYASTDIKSDMTRNEVRNNRPGITAPNYSHIPGPQRYQGSTENVRRFSAEQRPFVQHAGTGNKSDMTRNEIRNNQPDITAANYSHIPGPQGYPPTSTGNVRRMSAEQRPLVQHADTIIKSDMTRNAVYRQRPQVNHKGAPSPHLAVRSPVPYHALSDSERASIHYPRANSINRFVRSFKRLFLSPSSRRLNRPRRVPSYPPALPQRADRDRMVRSRSAPRDSRHVIRNRNGSRRHSPTHPRTATTGRTGQTSQPERKSSKSVPRNYDPNLQRPYPEELIPTRRDNFPSSDPRQNFHRRTLQSDEEARWRAGPSGANTQNYGPGPDDDIVRRVQFSNQKAASQPRYGPAPHGISQMDEEQRRRHASIYSDYILTGRNHAPAAADEDPVRRVMPPPEMTAQQQNLGPQYAVPYMVREPVRFAPDFQPTGAHPTSREHPVVQTPRKESIPIAQPAYRSMQPPPTCSNCHQPVKTRNSSAHAQTQIPMEKRNTRMEHSSSAPGPTPHRKSTCAKCSARLQQNQADARQEVSSTLGEIGSPKMTDDKNRSAAPKPARTPFPKKEFESSAQTSKSKPARTPFPTKEFDSSAQTSKSRPSMGKSDERSRFASSRSIPRDDSSSGSEEQDTITLRRTRSIAPERQKRKSSDRKRFSIGISIDGEPVTSPRK